MIAADQHHLEDDNLFPSTVYWRMCDIARELEREIAEVTKQRNRLAEALKSVASGAVEEANCIKIARESLAAVKGGTP